MFKKRQISLTIEALKGMNPNESIKYLLIRKPRR